MLRELLACYLNSAGYLVASPKPSLASQGGSCCNLRAHYTYHIIGHHTHPVRSDTGRVLVEKLPATADLVALNDIVDRVTHAPVNGDGGQLRESLSPRQLGPLGIRNELPGCRDGSVDAARSPDRVGVAVAWAVRVAAGLVAANTTSVQMDGSVAVLESVEHDRVSAPTADEHANLAVNEGVIEDGVATHLVVQINRLHRWISKEYWESQWKLQAHKY